MSSRGTEPDAPDRWRRRLRTAASRSSRCCRPTLVDAPDCSASSKPPGGVAYRGQVAFQLRVLGRPHGRLGQRRGTRAFGPVQHQARRTSPGGGVDGELGEVAGVPRRDRPEFGGAEQQPELVQRVQTMATRREQAVLARRRRRLHRDRQPGGRAGQRRARPPVSAGRGEARRDHVGAALLVRRAEPRADTPAARPRRGRDRAGRPPRSRGAAAASTDRRRGGGPGIRAAAPGRDQPSRCWAWNSRRADAPNGGPSAAARRRAPPSPRTAATRRAGSQCVRPIATALVGLGDRLQR